MLEEAGQPGNEIDVQRQQLDESRKLALRFFDTKGPEQLYIHKTILNAQIQLMKDIVSNNDAGFDARQASRDVRSFRVLEVLKGFKEGGMFSRFNVCILEKLTTVGLWSEVTASEQRSSDVFRTSMRAAAVCHELLTVPCSGFPWQLFNMLDDVSHAETTMLTFQSRPCLLDCWSRGFLAEIEAQFGPRALASDIGVAIVESMAQFLMCNIFDVERTHTSHANRSRRRTTHRLALAFLAVFHQAEAGPSWFSEKRASKKQVLLADLNLSLPLSVSDCLLS